MKLVLMILFVLSLCGCDTSKKFSHEDVMDWEDAARKEERAYFDKVKNERPMQPPWPREGWTFHEVYPHEGESFVVWMEGERNPNDNFRPSHRDIPVIAAFMAANRAPDPEDGQPFGENAIVWRDMSVPGGYTWVQARMGYLRGEAKDDPRPPKEKL